ncbi:RNA polymerase recycling motor HelD [Lactobacillus sp. Sy-1]|uniref:RNA polymerase recycling motor HelD n=1 Tax=Lactobacillus sp. Sy-1 TaxID=2109645 RepID=UPI001C59AB42|nr:RNA polymerase recycling motor HelD [Lactobacillus sp. Sy-1]MBW1605289.1 AAA family ATPase [Lactobacillus sp. Sy-1]
MADSIKEYEQHHLDVVEDEIRTQKHKFELSVKKAERDESAIQDNFYNDVRLNSGTYSGLMDTSVSIRQQQQLLDERQNSWNSATAQVEKLTRLQERPYFARIDIHEHGENRDEKIYIGLASLADSPDHYLIYDWRAPISSIYYENKLGEVKYATPDGEQTVDVKLKRQFQIENGKIQTIFDTDAAIGDQLLLKNLSNQSSTKMKSIVTTIQREQNQIIRDTKSDLLFVQGAAGSGKTAAVLQRVAFLLYRYRGNLNSSQVILFSPNQLFNDYINQVLPELGEQNMVQMTYYQYASHRLPNLEVENLSQRFLEDNSGATHKRKINDFKSSLAYFKAVTNYADSLNHAGMHFRNIKFQGSILFSKEMIRDIYYGFNDNYNLRNRIDGTRESLVKRLNRRIKSEMKSKWVESAIQDLSDEQLRTIRMGHPEEFADPDAEYRFLAKHIVIGAFKKVHRQIIHNRFLSINNQVVTMLKQMPQLIDLSNHQITAVEWQAGINSTVKGLKNGQISMADVSAYLYLYDRMTGRHVNRDIRYLFIDEVQDYTPFQLAFLKYSFPRAKFTLLGDLNQAIFTHENSHSMMRDLATMFDPEKTRVIELNKSYRSTEQITDFSKYLLGSDSKIESFARQGALPVINVTKDQPAALDVLQGVIESESGETIAVIGKTLADCIQLSSQLNDRGIKNNLLRTENQRLTNGVLVIPSYLAKGLEFDSVVMWDASKKQYPGEDDRQLVYTICTRAMHDLTVIAEKELSPLFSAVPAERYQLK